MSSVKISGNASGVGIFEIAAPNSATNRTQTLPDATGTVVLDSATQTLTNKTIQGGAITSGTAVPASGTSVDFIGIPSWAKRITVMFNGVSTAGTGGVIVSPPMIQIGSSGAVANTGYVGAVSVVGAGVATQGAGTTGFLLNPSTTYTGSTYAYSGAVTLFLLNSSTNLWVISGVLAIPIAPYTVPVAGHKALAGALDILRLTTESGADNFDAGTINILYE